MPHSRQRRPRDCGSLIEQPESSALDEIADALFQRKVVETADDDPGLIVLGPANGIADAYDSLRDIARWQLDGLAPAIVRLPSRPHRALWKHHVATYQWLHYTAQNPAYWGASEPRSRGTPACNIEVCPVQTGLLGGTIVSLTLQSDTEAQDSAPTRREALHEAGSVASESDVVSIAPTTSQIVAGWYADPMGSPLSRWWDGTAWTAELSAETAGEPGAAAPSAAVPVAAEPSATVPFVAVPSLDPSTADVSAAPLSRRQLRELVGPLTTGPVQIDAAVAVIPTPAPVVPVPAPAATPAGPSAVFVAGPANKAGMHSPFEALFESSAAERESAERESVGSATFDKAVFIDSSHGSNSSVARPWIGAATPLVPAASALSPAAVQLAPPVPADAPRVFVAEAVAHPVSASPPVFSASSLGFTLPPDPFAAAGPAENATAPSPFVALRAAPVIVPAVLPTLAGPTRSSTATVWLFTFLPVIHVALVWFVLVFLDLGGDQLVRYSVLGAPLFLYLVFAFADRRVLRSRGFERPASVMFAIIPLVYLLVRAVRVGAAGVAPLLLWLLIQTAAFSFLLLQFPAVFALVPLTSAAHPAPAAVINGPITAAQRASQLTPTGMAAELSRQTLAKNLTFSSISCPPIPVNLDGTAVTCVGTLASVKLNLNVVIDSTLPNSAFALVSEAPAS